MRLPVAIRRHWAAGSWGIVVSGAVAYAALVLAGEHGSLVRAWCGDALLWVGAALAIAGARRRESDRAAFIVLGCTLGVWAAGQQVWTLVYHDDATPPFPSWSDALWLSCYAGYYTTLWMLARRRLRGLPKGAWLDGLVGLFALGSFSLLLLLHGNLTDGPVSQVATTLAYPVGDLVLIAFLLGLVGATGWRIGRAWLLLIAGMVINAVADLSYVFVASTGNYDAWVDVVFVVAFLCLAAACWQPAQPLVPVRVGRGWDAIAAPMAGMSASAVLLGWMALADPHHTQATVAALAALLLGLVRVLLTHRENLALAASRREAITDDLTGLANRRHLLRRLEDAIDPGVGGEPPPVALLLIDLDRFKELNDSRGHQAGDHVLTELGTRLRRLFEDEGLAARLGGDEFAIVLPGADREKALDAAARVHRALVPAFTVPAGHAGIGASIGVALAPMHGDSPSDLLRRADLAMYEAKRAGTGTQVSAPGDGNGSGPSARLRRALEIGEFELHFQPQADLATDRVSGVEALVRWRHPERGVLAPADFLPAVRDAGLTRRLTRVLLGQALEQAREWSDEGIWLPIAVNVAAEDVLDPRFPGEIEGLLAATGVAPELLRIEITESAPIADVVLVAATLRRLRATGVQVSLDDFGTGYSALAYLRQLDLDELKLDRALVADVHGDAAGAAVVRAAVELAHTLGLRVVAEGIEDAESWRLLGVLGCDAGQGFHLGRPMPAYELALWLARRPVRRRIVAPTELSG
jgi:diguanylate cyclase (GGDEF)-like protein